MYLVIYINQTSGRKYTHVLTGVILEGRVCRILLSIFDNFILLSFFKNCVCVFVFVLLLQWENQFI